MNVWAAIGAMSLVAALLLVGHRDGPTPAYSVATAQTESESSEPEARCSDHHGFAVEAVPVVKTSDSSQVLASVEWGYSSAAGLCYLVLDAVAAQILQLLHYEPGEEGDPAAATTCSVHHGFASEPVPVVKTQEGIEIAYVYWGYNPSAQICYLTLDQAATAALRAWHRKQKGESGAVLPRPSPFDGRYLTVSAGGQHGAHACAIDENRALACWGSNYAGQSDPPEAEYWAVEAGGSHTCAVIAGGQVFCWGDNSVGQSDPPEGEFIAIATGSIHTCAVRAHGSVACWGKNNIGQALPPEGEFTAVASGGYHSCGLLADGAAVCWGQGSVGQTTPPEGEFTSIASGWYHLCAVRTDGAVVCWGDNSRGQTEAPTGSYTDVAAGGEHSCAVRILVCWGNNYAAQSSPPPGKYLSVDAGEDLTCAIRHDQAVVCWGNIAPSPAT